MVGVLLHDALCPAAMFPSPKRFVPLWSVAGLCCALTAAGSESNGEHGAAEGHHAEGHHSEGHHSDDHHADGHHAESHRAVVGIKGGYVAEFEGESVHHFGGAGPFIELVVIPHWLEVELGVRAITDGHALSFPTDLLLKLPFHLSDVVHPFVGLGPTMVASHHEEVSVHFGGVLVAGSYFWLTPYGGPLAEASYGMVDHHGLIHEIALNVGWAMRWW